MSKITRYNGNLKAFASEATGTERTIFGDTAQSDTLDANITMDLLRGWGVIGVASNPTKQHFNGLAFTLGQLIAYLHQQGVPEWNAAQEYYAGSVVTTLAGIYRLKSGGVGSSDPDTDGGVNWELIPTQAKVDAKADKATTYSETEVDGLLDEKADQANTYTETEVDNLLNAKASLSGATFSGPIGIGITPNGVLNNGKSLALGDSDTGIRQNGDGVLEIISNSETVVTIDKASGITGKNLSGTNTGDQTLSEIGVGQTWQDLTASRAMDVTYTNSTGKPIFVSIYSPGGTDANALVVDGIVVAKASDSDANTTTVYAIVPNNSTYHRPSGSGVDRWTELR